MFRQLINECRQIIAESDQYQSVDRDAQTKTSGASTKRRIPQRKMPDRGSKRQASGYWPGPSNRTELGPEVPYSQPPLPEDVELHRNSVKALRRLRRGRDVGKPQVETPEGWRDIEEYGSPGRRFDAY